MKFKDILDALNESIRKILLQKDSKKKDKMIISLAVGINVLMTEYPFTIEQMQVLISIKGILAKEYKKSEETLSMDDLEKGLDDLLTMELIDDKLEELLSAKKNVTKKVKERRKKIDWINDLPLDNDAKRGLKDWFNGDLLQLFIGSINIPSTMIDGTQDHLILYELLENKSGNKMALVAYIKENNEFIFSKIIERTSTKGRIPLVSSKKIKNKRNFNITLKNVLIANYK